MAVEAPPANYGMNTLPMEDFSRIKIPTQLVAPVPRGAPPNALTERKFFTKVGQSLIVKAQPKSVHFSGFTVGDSQTKTLRLTNISHEVQRWHIIPPASEFFKVRFKKPERCVPGLFMDMHITFTADTWRYYHDVIRVHCQGDENIVVPLHAYPVMCTEELPESVTLPVTPVGQTTSYTLPLSCTAPIDFQFSVRVSIPHIAFTVQPLSGLVPANGTTEITVSFTPKEFNTAVCKLELLISQFNASPLTCTFIGNALPGHHRFLAQHEQLQKAQPLPPVLSLDQPRPKPPAKKQTDEGQLTKSTEVEYQGHRFPLNLNNVHAVNYVLTQQQGKLKIKHLKHALENMRRKGRGTRQMKEAVFQSAVRQDVLEERANSIRWQVHLGSQPMSEKARELVLEDRERALAIYRTETRAEPIAEDEYQREENHLSTRRTYRRADHVAPRAALFDSYKNNMFAKRHFAKERFKLAVRKAMIQYRCNKRVLKTRQMILDYKAGLIGKPKKLSYFDNPSKEDIGATDCLQMDARTVDKFQFPVYEAPGHKDDMAPDALGRVPVKTTEVRVKRKTPVFELTTGKSYEHMGYSRYSIYEHRTGYVRPGLARPLRTGAEDEVVRLPMAEDAVHTTHEVTAGVNSSRREMTSDHVTSLAVTSLAGSTHAAAADGKPGNSSVVASKSLVTLQAPEKLAKAIEYHPLHIFNPQPGLQTFYQPLAYSETDPDFHLCPVPRYTPREGSVHSSNPHMSTQLKYVDEEEVIRGVMTWKKYPSQSLLSLASTPTLAQVYVPRLSDPFVSAVLPELPPFPVQTGLAEEDADLAADTPDTTVQHVLTPESIAQQFFIPSGFNEKDGELLKSAGKLPASHHNPTSLGQPSRALRESQLEALMAETGGGGSATVKLGEKIQEKIAKYNTLCSEDSLVLK